MSCVYTFYDEKTGKSEDYTYEDLVRLFQENGYRDFSDIVYSRGTKQDSVFSDVLAAKKDFKAQVSGNRVSGEPDYTPGSVLTTQTFIDSGNFRFKGEEVIREQNDADYVANIVKSYIDEGMSENEAKQRAENTLQNWQIINEDAKELHALLNTFSFQTSERYDFIKHLEGTKFEDLASSIYDQIMGEGGLFHIVRGRHNLSNDASVKVVQGVNLLAKLNHIGEDIIGHIDNLVIDTNGTLHIYNYKLTSTPISEWDAVKKEKYRFQMALLKQILAHNGFNVTGTQLHIIPIRVDYSDDFSKINSTTVYSQNHIQMPVGQAFNKYETIAKYFIKSNIKLEPIKSKVVQQINKNLNFIFPQRNITIDGIQKSVDEWIKFNYSSKWENRIKRVDAEDHTYELYFNDDFTDPVLIEDPTEPINNEKLKNAVTKYLQDINTSNSEFLGRIVQDILVSKRLGKSIIERGKAGNRNLQIAGSFLGKSLDKYITSYKEVQGVKVFDWDLISNDTLLDANILLFRNNETDQVDVVCLSNFNLRAKTSFNGQKNIMGSYINDASKDTKGLINFSASYANIEAVKTMTILNEVLPQLNQSDFILGEMRILSTQNGGMMELYDMESLNRDLFQEVVRVVKKNAQGFEFTNNFTKSKYLDPLKVLIYDYQRIISNASLTASEQQEVSDIGFANLESLSTREQKRVELRAMIEKIFKLDPTLQTMKPRAVLESARSDSNSERRALANLYILCQNAFCYYSGIQVANEYKIGKVYEYGLTQNRIPNKTYQGVTTMFTRTVDDIASKVKEEYNHIYNFTMNFYDNMGFGGTRASMVGDQAKAFNNLYRRDKSGNLLMEFRNPYQTDSLPPLNNHEKKYLKQVLFELAKIRSEMYGFNFNFSRYNLDDAELIRFIEQNKGWYFNPPLEKASQATIRANGFKNMVDEWSDRAKKLIRDPKAAFDLAVQSIGTAQEAELMEKTFDTLHLQNSFVMGDGYKGGEASRSEMINSHPDGFFETNVENLLAHYLEKHVQVKEFNKALIAIKGTLLQLEMLNDMVGEENRAGIVQTIKMIQDFTKQNVFNISIMEPESQKIMAWVHPFRQLVSKAYIAGNIVSAFRDTFEGMWQNTARMLTKYQTDIDSKSLTSAYKEVTKASFTSIRNITIIDELCKTYRLSNLDVARISEGLTTSRGGVLNVENWMYATLRAPDFLNRMVLFVAKCMKDGCWDAFDLEDNKLVYNWKKDKRYSIYADPSKKGTKEYEEQRIAYYNAVRQYNREHPENTIDFSDDLPAAYSNDQIQQMRQLSNSIYGAYDKSMRAKYENTALGLSFAMFSTWMNGMVSNYITKPGQYSGGLTEVEQDRDGSGNLLFMDKNGLTVVEVGSGENKQYIYEETGETVTDLEGMVPIMKNVPLVVQGIWYTIKDSIKALRQYDDNGNWIGKSKFMEEIIANPMQYANLRKLISDLLFLMLFYSLFKFAISPLYQEYKKEMVDHSVAENAIAEVLYKSTSRSYDGFMGPLAAFQFLGENTNPPFYSLSTKVTGDLGKFVFGDKTFGQLMTGNIAFFRAFQDTYKAEVKKD